MNLDILIVDDEPDIRSLVSGILSDEGFSTRVAATGKEALDAIASRQPHLLVLDVWLGDPEYDGLKLLKLIKKTNPDLPIVMISGHGTVETAVSAIKSGAYDFIEKPFKIDRLLLVIARAIEAAALKQENRHLKAGLPPPQLVGHTPVMRGIRRTIEKVASVNSRILLTGPVGVGKELVAREIHAKSKRASGPFLVFHSARGLEISQEEQLFGTEPTTTNPRRLGLLEQSHGGTLLIDEVTELSLPVQAKLIRFLQENLFTRVGGGQKVSVDVRLLVATQHDLKSFIKDGFFRNDLYYRLNVVSITLPSLRERAEDIPPLVDYFVDKFVEQAGVPPRLFERETLAIMQSYKWPGNVHELRNVVERALILSPAANDSMVTPEELPPEVRGQKSIALHGTTEFFSLPLREAREFFERTYLLAQLQKFAGNISRAAVFVGMERSALHRKLRQLDVDPDTY